MVVVPRVVVVDELVVALSVVVVEAAVVVVVLSVLVVEAMRWSSRPPPEYHYRCPVGVRPRPPGSHQDRRSRHPAGESSLPPTTQVRRLEGTELTRSETALHVPGSSGAKPGQGIETGPLRPLPDPQRRQTDVDDAGGGAAIRRNSLSQGPVPPADS